MECWIKWKTISTLHFSNGIYTGSTCTFHFPPFLNLIKRDVKVSSVSLHVMNTHAAMARSFSTFTPCIVRWLATRRPGCWSASFHSICWSVTRANTTERCCRLWQPLQVHNVIILMPTMPSARYTPPTAY